MLTRFWERLAIRILLRSPNITMFAFKDRALEQFFIAANREDPAAWDFFERNQGDKQWDSRWAGLERAFHAPDAESDT